MNQMVRNSAVIIIMIFSILLNITRPCLGISNEIDELTLNINLILADQNYDPIDGTHDIQVKIGIGNVYYWNKVFESETIDNGALSIELSGFDTQSPPVLLIPEMFESKNTDITIIVNAEVITLELSSHPYAVKSRLSDISHSTLAIQDVPIQSMDESLLSSGNMLVIDNNQWVPIETLVSLNAELSTLHKTLSLSDLRDVEITDLSTNQILTFNGKHWVNIDQDELDAIMIDQLLTEYGFLKVVSPNNVVLDDYPDIFKIGDAISITTASSMVTFEKDSLIDGDLIVNGMIGDDSNPIEQLYTHTLTLVNNVAQTTDTPINDD